MRFRLTITALMGATLLLSPAQAVAAQEFQVGLRAELGDVRMQNLAIGKTYSLSRMNKAPLILRNNSEDSIKVMVKVIVPSRHELENGVHPVPDASWVHLDERALTLPPGAVVHSDVRVTVPYDPDLAGKTFRVDLWSYGVDVLGKSIGRGQRHRLLFTVEMDYRDDTEAQFSSRILYRRHIPR